MLCYLLADVFLVGGIPESDVVIFEDDLVQGRGILPLLNLFPVKTLKEIMLSDLL